MQIFLFGLVKSVILEFKMRTSARNFGGLQKQLLEKRKSKDQIQSVELEEREGWIKGKLSEEISWQEEEEASGKETEGGFKRGSR